MEKLCSCGNSFNIDAEDTAFLKRISFSAQKRTFVVPLSAFCPGCREQQRLSFRNEWNLYRRTCAKSGKEVIAIYPQDTPFPVYAQSLWWSDQYDPQVYGRNFDFSRPFFEQFDELNRTVPKLAIQNAKSENSAHTNYSWENKNCYLAVGTGNSEDCYYCYRVTKSKDVCDSYDLHKCELCYQCNQCTNLYACSYVNNCHNSSNLFYCENCRGSQNCIGCSNLRNAQFCIFNKNYSEAEYRELEKALKEDLLKLKQTFDEIKHNFPPPDSYIINCEDSSGNQLLNCSRCRHSFTVKDSQDCRYFGTGENNRDCQDCNFSDNCELQYFSTNLEKNYRVLFSALVWYTNNGAYLNNCFNSTNLFGCSGMKRSGYCILNKQYSEDGYHKLLSKIIDHMKETKEWGQFFPISISPFPYNKSLAFEYYPVDENTAKEKGYSWENDSSEPKTSSPEKDGITSEIRCCSASGKPYRITTQEKGIYRKLGIGLPNKCPQIRHLERMRLVKRSLESLY